MADVKIYGSTRSRASVSMWTAKELGIPYEQVEITHPEMKEAAYLAINPNGKVPALVDGDVKLFESMAINLYLAKKYGLGKLYPSNIEDEGRTWQWTLWSATELEPLVMPILGFRLLERGDAASADAAEEKLKTTLKVLDAALKGREHLVGDRFSVADINVASAVGLAAMCKVDLSSLPNVKAWLDRCNARPARAA